MSEKIQQLQLIEQNSQQILKQKQQFQAEQLEIDSALHNLKESHESYKIIGNIMVKLSREALEKELNSKKDIVELKLKTLEKQEEKLREKAKSLRKDVLKNVEKND